jgi:hypothetical protein
MGDQVDRLAAILREAADTHHQVYRIVDGEDPDWATWYADWLVSLSKLPEVVGMTPVRSELVYLLVRSDKENTAEHPDEPWDSFYAARILEHFPAAAS